MSELPPPSDVDESTLRLSHLLDLLGKVRYKNWRINIGGMDRGHFLQCVLDACNDKGENWTGRKWYLSPHMIDEEIVLTAFKAVMTAEEHETREQFLFNGRAIFGPHLSLEALVANADKVSTR